VSLTARISLILNLGRNSTTLNISYALNKKFPKLDILVHPLKTFSKLFSTYIVLLDEGLEERMKMPNPYTPRELWQKCSWKHLIQQKDMITKAPRFQQQLEEMEW
jgi:hypothetical protein